MKLTILTLLLATAAYAGNPCEVFEHCSPEQITAACQGRVAATVTTTSTTTTLAAVSAPKATVVQCRHYNATRTRGFRCLGNVGGVTTKCQGYVHGGLFGCRVPLT